MAMIITTLTMKSLNEEVIRGVICRPLNAPNTQNTISSINSDDAYPLDANNDYDDDDSPGDIEDDNNDDDDDHNGYASYNKQTSNFPFKKYCKNIANMFPCRILKLHQVEDLQIIECFGKLKNWKIALHQLSLLAYLVVEFTIAFCNFFKSSDRSNFLQEKLNF